jgi:hypothetical protein
LDSGATPPPDRKKQTLRGWTLFAYYRVFARVLADFGDGHFCHQPTGFLSVYACSSPSWTAFQAERGRDFRLIVDDFGGMRTSDFLNPA